MSKYDAMTIEELQAEFVSLGSQLVTIQNARQEILAMMDARKKAVTVKFSLESATEADKDTLRALLDKPEPVSVEVAAAVEAVK